MHTHTVLRVHFTKAEIPLDRKIALVNNGVVCVLFLFGTLFLRGIIFIFFASIHRDTLSIRTTTI